MTETSARFALPFILPGQAQKEAFHNEALALIDAALHACVAGDPTDEVPTVPAAGESWIVGPGATGAWAGHVHNRRDLDGRRLALHGARARDERSGTLMQVAGCTGRAKHGARRLAGLGC